MVFHHPFGAGFPQHPPVVNNPGRAPIECCAATCWALSRYSDFSAPASGSWSGTWNRGHRGWEDGKRFPANPKDKFNLSTLIKNKFNLIIWNCALRSPLWIFLSTSCQHFSSITVLNLFWEKLGPYRHALSSKIVLWQTVFDIGNLQRWKQLAR